MIGQLSKLRSQSRIRNPWVHCGWWAVILSATQLGCHRPFQFEMRSPMKVAMLTPLRMSGEVTTRNPPDNRATPIVGRFVAGNANRSPCQFGIAVIDVDGVLLNRNYGGFGSMGENPLALFREKLNAARQDTRAQAVVLRINSPGGSVTATDIMRQELTRFRQQTGLPVIACIMDTGTGGAYYLATACDAIIAHPTSLVGAVGVILNLYNMEDTLQQFNITPQSIRAGQRVDAGSPVRPITDEEQEMLRRIAEQFHQRFIDAVLEGRPGYLGRPEVDFDGQVFTAEQALRNGLIDQIGYLDDAIALAAGTSDRPDPNPQVLLYRRDNDRANTPYDITPNVPQESGIFPMSLPGLERARLPMFLYMWQLDPTLERVGG